MSFEYARLQKKRRCERAVQCDLVGCGIAGEKKGGNVETRDGNDNKIFLSCFVPVPPSFPLTHPATAAAAAVAFYPYRLQVQRITCAVDGMPKRPSALLLH